MSPRIKSRDSLGDKNGKSSHGLSQEESSGRNADADASEAIADDEDDDEADQLYESRMEKSIRKVQNYYRKQVFRGWYPNVEELVNYCNKRKIEPRPSRKSLKLIRLGLRASVAHARWRRPNPHFMTDMVKQKGYFFSNYSVLKNTILFYRFLSRVSSLYTVHETIQLYN
jgi:hypothetical protein